MLSGGTGILFHLEYVLGRCQVSVPITKFFDHTKNLCQELLTIQKSRCFFTASAETCKRLGSLLYNRNFATICVQRTKRVCKAVKDVSSSVLTGKYIYFYQIRKMTYPALIHYYYSITDNREEVEGEYGGDDLSKGY